MTDGRDELAFQPLDGPPFGDVAEDQDRRRPCLPSFIEHGVAEYSTGKLDPSGRQNVSSATANESPRKQCLA